MPRFKLANNTNNFMTLFKVMDLHPEVKKHALALLMQGTSKQDIY
jgi:hypothetical protein